MKFRFIYPLSVLISYLIMTNMGKIQLDFGISLGILVYALWLSAPLLVEENDSFWISYVLWVIIQWVIFYYGIRPPDSVPGF